MHLRRLRRWPDLPPDLLCEISGRIHVASDFVRFHAVCKAWHESHEQATRKKTTDQFLPWLLASNKKKADSLEFRCVFSKSSYLVRPPVSGTGKNWVASADGTTVRYFTAGPTLTDALTGDVTPLPPFLDGQWEEENPSGIIYSDDTVLLYSKHDSSYGDTAEVRVALLCTGDDEWTVVRRTLEFPGYCEFCVVYHAGKILVTVEDSFWHVVTMTPSTTGDDDVYFYTVPRPSSMPRQRDGYFYEYSYALESRGELLWASVHIRTDYPEEYSKDVHGLVRALSVSVHALEEAPDPRWVRKEGTSLADRVLFLGWPNSFSVDASRVGMSGGFAYFVYCDPDKGRGCMSHEQGGVFRYNLIDNTAEFVEWLPQGWGQEMCTWLVHQPTIGPLRSTRCSYYSKKQQHAGSHPKTLRLLPS